MQENFLLRMHSRVNRKIPIFLFKNLFFALRFPPSSFGSPFLAPKVVTEHLLGVTADANLN